MNKILWSYIYLLAVVFLAGCTPQQQQDPFIEESPFQPSSERDLSNVFLITCTCRMFEIPSNIDVSDWFSAGHAQPAATDLQDPENTEQPTATAIVPTDNSTLDQQQVRTWQANGLKTAVFSNDDWSKLRERIVAANAVSLPTRQSVIRRPDEVAELPLLSLAQQQSVFVSGGQGQLQGYTLPGGAGMFRLNANIAQFSPHRRVYFELMPLVRSRAAQGSFGRDEYGTLRQLSRNPEIMFDQLPLSGILEDNWSICVAADSTAARLDSLGQILMVDRNAGVNVQVVFILTLEIRTAEELRDMPQ